MRAINLRSALCGLLLLAACNEEQAEPAKAEPTLGGTMVLVGTHYVELRPEASGSVDAMVYDRSAKPLTADAKMDLTAQVQTEAGVQPVALKWDPALLHFHGEVKGDAASLVSGPAEVTVALDGKAEVGKLPHLVVLPQAEHGGTVLVAGDFSAELLTSADGSVRAYVSDSLGAKITGDVDTQFSAEVRGAGDVMQRVALKWSADEACFVGRVKGEIALTAGPVWFVALPKGKAEWKGRLAWAAVAPAPSIEGTVVIAGNHSIELHALDDVQVEAVVTGPEGVVRGDAGAELTMQVRGAVSAFQPVKFVWNPARARFVAKLEGHLSWGAPFRVDLRSKGRLYHGAVLKMPAIAAPSARAHFVAHAEGRGKGLALGHLHAHGRGQLEHGLHGKVSARVKGPRAKLEVKAPKVKVKAPSAKVSARAGASAKGKAKAKAKGGVGTAGVGAQGSVKLKLGK